MFHEPIGQVDINSESGSEEITIIWERLIMTMVFELTGINFLKKNCMQIQGEKVTVQYTPEESHNFLFGGNNNWCGPVWMNGNAMMHLYA